MRAPPVPKLLPSPDPHRALRRRAVRGQAPLGGGTTRVLAVLTMLLAGTLPAVARASRLHPPPPPPPPTPAGARLFETFVPDGSSLRFNVAETVAGYGFSPQERITVSANPPVIAPATVTSDPTGVFQLPVRFHWVFCGPGAAAQPRPVFTAAGERGDVAHTTPTPVNCPLVITKPGRLPKVGAVGSNKITGFGFRAHETITLRLNGPGQDAAARTRVVANAQGEISRSVATRVIPPCTDATYRQLLIAEGALGTSVVATLLANPPPPPATFCPPPSVAAVPPGTTLASLRLSPAAIRPGHYERATAEQFPNGPVGLVIRYPAGGTSRLSANTGPNFRAEITWRIPRNAAPGVAHVLLRYMTEPQAPLPAMFRIQR